VKKTKTIAKKSKQGRLNFQPWVQQLGYTNWHKAIFASRPTPIEPAGVAKTSRSSLLTRGRILAFKDQDKVLLC